MQTRDAINQVQPDYLDKSQLIPVTYAALVNGTDPGSLSTDMVRREPQWLHQVTIVDKPATTGNSGVTSYTSVERINWEVTENFLVARQAYDRLQGAQTNPNAPPIGNNARRGEIVAMYHIDSHFDIRRSYNTTTGEELNVVVENSTDRPWYLRRFMRVDWSQNLLDSFTPLEYGIWQGRVAMEPVASYFNNPDDPNRPVFDYGNMNGQDGVLRYFDVTNRAVLHPETTNLADQGYPNIPTCALFDHATDSCQPADVLMRQAFYRVDPMRDYQPQALDGHRMERFGFFTADRQGFSDYLGGVGQLERRHFADRHNLWQQHHVRLQNGLDHQAGDRACQSDYDCAVVSDTARCDMSMHTCGEIYQRCAPQAGATDPAMMQSTADAQCASAGVGATCDLDVAYNRGDSSGLCLLPLRQRQVRQIPYHLSPNYPERMMPVTRQIATEWNAMFSNAVRQARYRECLLDPAGGGAAACESWRDLNNLRQEARDSQFVWVGCHNPVWGTDANLPGAHSQADVDAAHAAGWDLEGCGAQGTVARIGDIRYSMIGSVNQYDQQGPWGLAEISGDPTTGEVISGRGAVWQTVTDAQAAYVTDMIRLLNRERDLTVERFALGQTVIDAYDYVRANGGYEQHTARGNAPINANPRPVLRDIQSQDELSNILAQTTFDHLRVVAPENQIQDPHQLTNLARQSDGTPGNEGAMLNALMRQYSGLIPNGNNAEDSASRMGRLRGTPIENRLVNNPEALLAADQDPQGGVTPAALEAASPARRMSNTFRTLQIQMQQALETHECRYDSQAFSDDVITVMLRRFRRNEVPEDVRFGQMWNFHRDNPAACPDDVATDASGNPNCALNYEEIQRYLTQFIHHGVLAHELGHSIGERHNFSGSADAMNYPDQYWNLRRTASGTMVPADQIQPRYVHQAMGRPFYSQQEENEGVEEYAYSTVMDYVGWNQDAHGLQRYDRAFVLHGYVDMVEAFDQVADPDAARNMFEGIDGGYQPAFHLTFGGTSAAPTAVTYHYTDIPRIVGLNAQGNPNIGDDNRYPVFLRETARTNYGPLDWQTPSHTNSTMANRDGTPASTPHVIVPHRFGTDDWANYLWHSQRYDAGPDAYESMRYVAEHYMDYYFSNAFARNRASFTVSGYRSRMTGRYLDQTYYSMRSHVYLETIYRNAYGAFADMAFNQPGIQAGRVGVSTVMDMLSNAVIMPQASALYAQGGHHCLHTRTDGTRMWDLNINSTTCVDVPVNQGRDYSSYYDYGSGMYWRERIINAGSYHDKDLGLSYMTDTFLFVPGRTVVEFQDFHPLQINAYTIYPGQTLRFFGSLLSRDHNDVGVQVRPRTGSDPELLRTQYALLNLPSGTGAGHSGRDPALSAIDPNMGFSTELQALAYLFGQLANTFDHAALYSLRLCAEGDAWCLPATSTRTLVTFTNPFTNLVYSAPHIGAGAGEPGANVGLSARDAAANESGIAARMLLQANRLADAWRSAPMQTRAQRQQELQVYVDLLDRMREMNNYYRDVRDAAINNIVVGN